MKSKSNYLKWVFTNKWYYAIPIIWLILGVVVVYLLTGTLRSYEFPEDISVFSLIISLIFYYIIWQIPFFIFWFIRRRAK